MKITEIDIPKERLLEAGLEGIKMSKLGKTVLIAGKNGSGKSRILNQIFKNFKENPTDDEIVAAKRTLISFKEGIQQLEIEKTILKNKLKETGVEPYIIQPRIDRYNRDIEKYESAILAKQTVLSSKMMQIENERSKDSVIFYVPKWLNLSDPNQKTKASNESSATAINLVGFDAINDGALSKIQVVQDAWFNATHPTIFIIDEIKEKAIKDYNYLDEVINAFLGTRVGRDGNGNATIFNFPLGSAGLSDGQKILLQFAMAIYSQELSLQDLILFMDEPENHLHPAIIIELLERLNTIVTNGQLWIATHSIPLLAHFDPSLIWYVEDGKISYAGKTPEKVLKSLLGEEDELERLRDFINLPSQLATNKYAFECLFEPTSVMTGSSDHQSLQIRGELMKIKKGDKLKVLDYGVGKGRLISNLADVESKDLEKLISEIEYVGFDEYKNDEQICRNNLEKVFGNSTKLYFNKMNDLFTTYDKNSFDVVIMCNVLHEIEPKDWINLFKKDGIICSLLSENGILLLVEDQQIPIGEKAYQKGFLVLDTLQIKDLFKITQSDTNFNYSDLRGDGRLKAHQIPREYLERIDSDSRVQCIKSLSETAKQEIMSIRKSDKNYSNGKLHSFWTQQFANSQLILEEFTK